MISYRVLDHDADICLEVYGSSMEELFRSAAKALFSLITDPGSVSPSLTRTVIAEGNGELLVNFLNELLYLFDTQRFIPCDVSVSFTGRGLSATLLGEVFDDGRHVIEQEMKAVTYHKFAITETDGMFSAIIVIDV